MQESMQRRHGRVVLHVQAKELSFEHPLGLRGQDKWLMLLMPAMEKAGEMVGELAEAMGGEAEIPVVPFQGRHLN